ncbi:ABC transporter substrate-binding protein [Kibdelosporangium aridum]|uniref:Ribose transport system substrate-binding protein n=1 Tax=Kibdelosporangium aridum TaxID=2030 RepID=A0A1W2FFZ9_KIBAR|nr:ABC transporter substrate-binding protein [Kibdelosporangium aridum]SMD20508.1 ribose transport system substrate-binding protein [Kibdelosporangium aridum]
MRTKLIALSAVTLALAIGINGCGNTEEGASTRPKMTLIVGNEGDDFYKAMECGAKAAANRLGVELDLQGPRAFDTSLQVQIVNSVAAKRPAAVLIAPTDDTALYPPLKQIHAAGTKIVTVDTTLKNKDIVAAVVGSDYVQLGAAAARQLNTLVNGQGKILVIASPPGVTTSDLSRQGLTDALTRYPGLQQVPTQFSGGDAAKSASLVAATLSVHPDLAAVFTLNGGDAQGVVTALREAGKQDRVKFMSGDAQPFQVDQLKKGEVAALLLHKPFEIGEKGVEQALAAVKGQPVQPESTTSIVMATAANVDEPGVAKYLYRPC